MDYRWFVAVLLALVVWGAWGVVTRVASSSLGWRDTTAIAAVGHMSIAIAYIILSRAAVLPQGSAWYMALLAGALGFLGALLFYVALDLNPSSIVVVATSMYPVVTILLSMLFLGESISLRQAVGVGLAIAALVLISSR
ncbi:MAG: DMT family transporter [Candidatus Caldarchaeum sp.]|uniref:EamA family transporter n=1 Tax=Caldiarchaeum subterraneum TaxID=311458 RepID=A0A7J3VTH2_CALS0